MWYLLFAVLLAVVLATAVYLRHRGTRNPLKTVRGFERARDALKPEKRSRTP